MLPTEAHADRVVLQELDDSILDGLRGREERLAFWINLYNVLVAQGIAALGIRRSVWEVPDFFARISARIGGLVFSADEIEHGVLRGNRPHPLSGVALLGVDDRRRAQAIIPPDPRIHFAINCGARSCPPVRRYDHAGLHEQLEAATRSFVNQEVTLDGETLTASELFKWFRDDFADFAGGLAGFLARYLDEGPVRRVVLERGVEEMAWRAFDWRLHLPALRPPG